MNAKSARSWGRKAVRSGGRKAARPQGHHQISRRAAEHVQPVLHSLARASARAVIKVYKECDMVSSFMLNGMCNERSCPRMKAATHNYLWPAKSYKHADFGKNCTKYSNAEMLVHRVNDFFTRHFWGKFLRVPP